MLEASLDGSIGPRGGVDGTQEMQNPCVLGRQPTSTIYVSKGKEAQTKRSGAKKAALAVLRGDGVGK